jgi:hypothetical protein
LIELRLFGNLHRHAPDPASLPGTALDLSVDGDQTLGQVLAEMGIDPEEVSNVFLNGRLLPRSVYPMTLGYQLAADRPLTLEDYLAVPVQSGDRLGVFPRNMGAVVV